MEGVKQDIEQLLAEGKNIQVNPRGYSMYPLLVPGRDRVIIEPVKGYELKTGSVILYRRYTKDMNGVLILHRICKICEKGYYLVGDNQKEVEGPIKKEQVKGIMVGFIRKGKYISCKSFFYRVYGSVWLLLRPVRPIIGKNVARVKRRISKRR